MDNIKRELVSKEGEIKKQISAEYENKVYKLRLDMVLAKSELDWVREKLNSERQRWQSDIELSRQENKSIRSEIPKKIIELESDYKEKLNSERQRWQTDLDLNRHENAMIKAEIPKKIADLEADYKEKFKQIDESKLALELEKRDFQKNVDVVRNSYQQKINGLYDEMHAQRIENDKEIEKIAQKYSQMNNESARLRNSLELKIYELNIKLENEKGDNSKLKNQLSEYKKRYEEIQIIIEEQKKKYKEKIDLLSEELSDANKQVSGKISYVKDRIEAEKQELQTRFLQTERNLRMQIEEKRQKLISRENEIKCLRE